MRTASMRLWPLKSDAVPDMIDRLRLSLRSTASLDGDIP